MRSERGSRSELAGPAGGRTQGLFNTDLSVFKNFRFGKRARFQLRGEVFNAFNRRNIRTIETNLTNARFGQVTAYQSQRIGQLGARVSF